MAKLQMIFDGQTPSRSSCPIKLNKSTNTITIDLSRASSEQLRLTLTQDELIRIYVWAGRKLGR